jgi:antitoxin component of MazEF toxin-antitoxin module
LIVGARMNARLDQAVTIAWHGEIFARQKRLKPLDELLKRRKPKSPEQSAREVAAMLERMAQKKG